MSALIAEFPSPDALVSAVHEVLTLVGAEHIEAYTPHPMHELDALLQISRSRAPLWSLCGGTFGLLLAVVGQWWITAVDYPLNVGARPVNPIPAYVPVSFELTVLGVVVGALLSLLWECRLLRLWDPLFEVPTFARASQDRFLLRVDGGDVREVEAALLRGGASEVLPCG